MPWLEIALHSARDSFVSPLAPPFREYLDWSWKLLHSINKEQSSMFSQPSRRSSLSLNRYYASGLQFWEIAWRESELMN